MLPLYWAISVSGTVNRRKLQIMKLSASEADRQGRPGTGRQGYSFKCLESSCQVCVGTGPVRCRVSAFWMPVELSPVVTIKDVFRCC